MASPDRFDGLEVDKHQARFAGTIDLDPTDADRLSFDTEAMAVVVFRVGGAAVDENQAGDIVRTNKFKLRQVAIVRDAKLQQELYDKIASLDAPHPTLPFADKPEPLVPDGIDADTGEVFEDFGEPAEEEVFSPGGGARVKVGGARENDAVLRRFLETGS